MPALTHTNAILKENMHEMYVFSTWVRGEETGDVGDERTAASSVLRERAVWGKLSPWHTTECLHGVGL